MGCDTSPALCAVGKQRGSLCAALLCVPHLLGLFASSESIHYLARLPETTFPHFRHTKNSQHKREHQRDRGRQEQVVSTQRPRSCLQGFPDRAECVLVNPTSEEYKYLCCRNTFNEVLELLFSICFSLSEACLLLGPWEPCRLESKPLNTRMLQLLPCVVAVIALSTAPGAQCCPAKMGKDAAAFPAFPCSV